MEGAARRTGRFRSNDRIVRNYGRQIVARREAALSREKFDRLLDAGKKTERWRTTGASDDARGPEASG